MVQVPIGYGDRKPPPWLGPLASILVGVKMVSAASVVLMVIVWPLPYPPSLPGSGMLYAPSPVFWFQQGGAQSRPTSDLRSCPAEASLVVDAVMALWSTPSRFQVPWGGAADFKFPCRSPVHLGLLPQDAQSRVLQHCVLTCMREP